MGLDRVVVRDFLEALGIEIDSVSGDNMLFLCPFHSDRHPSARMNWRTTAWLCSVGCGKGNAIHFLSMLRQMSYEEARDHIYNRYGIGPTAPIDDLESEVLRNLGRGVELTPERVLPDESWVAHFRLDWEVDREHPAHLYMVEQRGFTPAALNRWEIGYDPLTERVAIPVRDVHGKLVGFKGRAICDDQYPRYLILGDAGDRERYGFQTYRKSEHVFGLDRCIRDSCWQRCCWVVEGELNAIAMRERFGEFAVAVAGSEFSDRQRELIASCCGVVKIYFDSDTAGSRGTAKVASMLTSFITAYAVIDAPDDAAAIKADVFHELQAKSVLELAVEGMLDLDLVAAT